MIIHTLAKLAVARARLQHGISTASACGDSAWVKEKRPTLDLLDAKINALTRVLSPKMLAEVQEITNAPL